MRESEVLEEIRRIARDELNVDREISPEDELGAALELDSLGLTVLAVGLEDRFRIRLDEALPPEARTVGDLARWVVARATRFEAEEVQA